MSLEGLIACAGSWRGTSTLQDPHAGVAAESPSTADVSPGPGGVRLDYTWSYQGKPQQGSILFGIDAAAGAVTARWTDTWHTGNQPMACSGQKRSGNTPGLGLADRRHARRRDTPHRDAQHLALRAGGQGGAGRRGRLHPCVTAPPEAQTWRRLKNASAG